MKYKKFFLIPILIFLYIVFINSLLELAFVPSESASVEGQTSGTVQQIGISSGVSVVVTRPYLFGIIELPVFIGGVGDISFMHNTFFGFIVFLIIIFVAIEWRKRHG